MRVRRKSEIAEAVEVKPGHWSVDGCRMTDEYFHAHYEPVPEPPAPKARCRGCFSETCFGDCMRPMRFHGDAAPSLSEEQPAELKAIHEALDRVTFPDPNDATLKGSPHRATIAMIPCSVEKGKFHIEIDGTELMLPANEFRYERPWCGTEAEAKAKLESLRHDI